MEADLLVQVMDASSPMFRFKFRVRGLGSGMSQEAVLRARPRWKRWWRRTCWCT